MALRVEFPGSPLHPPEVRGALGWYARGCRCDGCRAANAKAAKDRRRRIAMGLPGAHDRVPNDDAREVILRMRRAGMVWDGMQGLIGTDRRDLQRILGQPGGVMTRWLRDQVVAAGERLDADPRLAVGQRKVFHQGERVRWMVGCLLARGWTSDWIGEQVGWRHRFSTSTITYGDVNVKTWARVEGVFKAYHMEWGSSRVTAVRSWRRGWFLSDCYDWEGHRPDYRPVPGSFHHELVEEACAYKPQRQYRRKQMLMQMHAVWGQWEKAPCAAAALRSWQVAQGLPVEEAARLEVCGMQSHRHDLMPEIWHINSEANQ